MRKLAEMYNVPVVLGPFGTPQVWARQEVNVGLKVLFNGLSTSDESRKKGNALYIQERVPGMYNGDYMAEAVSRKATRRQPCSRTSTKRTCRGARGSARSSQASAVSCRI